MWASVIRNDMEDWHATFGLKPPFNRTYVGISYCFGGCGRLSLFPDLSFCQGSGHQTRRSQCRECYIVDANGEEVNNVGSSGSTNEREVFHAKALHNALVKSGAVPATCGRFVKAPKPRVEQFLNKNGMWDYRTVN